MIRRAPVAPVGWPIAMAPPLTLVLARISSVFFGSRPPRMSVDTRGIAANASLISIRSMSSIVRPALCSDRRADSAGMDASLSGWPEAMAQAMSVASDCLPRRFASSGDMSTSAGLHRARLAGHRVRDDELVLELDVAQAVPPPKVGQEVGHLAHVLRAPRERDRGLAQADRARSHVHRRQRRAARAVDRVGHPVR